MHVLVKDKERTKPKKIHNTIFNPYDPFPSITQKADKIFEKNPKWFENCQLDSSKGLRGNIQFRKPNRRVIKCILRQGISMINET